VGLLNRYQSGELVNKHNHTCTLDSVVSAIAKDLNGMTKTFNKVQVSTEYYIIDATKNMYNPQSSIAESQKK
jgi:hypothetical protein